MVALAAVLAASTADPAETFPGPASPAAQPQWLASQQAWRSETLAGISYNGSIYSDYLPWTSSLFIVPQVHIYDRFLYDPATGFTVDRFLADVTTRYGGVDGVLLWHSYPNMGVDDRNQFQLLEDIPGGLPALAGERLAACDPSIAATCKTSGQRAARSAPSRTCWLLRCAPALQHWRTPSTRAVSKSCGRITRGTRA